MSKKQPNEQDTLTQASSTDDLIKKAWREIWGEGYSLGYERGCEDATDWEWGSNKTSFTKETEREMEWEASETQAKLKRLVSTGRPELLAKTTKDQLILAREHVRETDSAALWECWSLHFKPRCKEDEEGKNKIENIIFSYCEGIEYLEFSESDLPDMISEIKEAILNELEDAEHLYDARNYVRDHL